MRAFLFLALALLGCGDDGAGPAQQAPAEAPPCDPPGLTCPEPERHESEPAGRVLLYCEGSDINRDMYGENVVGWTDGLSHSTCWPSGTVAIYDDGEGSPTACYDQAGAASDCEPVQDALAPAWGW